MLSPYLCTFLLNSFLAIAVPPGSVDPAGQGSRIRPLRQ